MADTNNQNSFLDYAGLALFWNNVKQIIKDNELVTATAITDLDTRVDQLEKIVIFNGTNSYTEIKDAIQRRIPIIGMFPAGTNMGGITIDSDQMAVATTKTYDGDTIILRFVFSDGGSFFHAIYDTWDPNGTSWSVNSDYLATRDNLASKPDIFILSSDSSLEEAINAINQKMFIAIASTHPDSSGGYLFADYADILSDGLPFFCFHYIKNQTVNEIVYQYTNTDEYNVGWAITDSEYTIVSSSNVVDLTSEQTITAKKTFSSGINLNGTTISKVGSPVNTDDAANKQYVDTKIDDIPVETGLGVESIVQKSGNNAYGKSSTVLGHGNIAGNVDKIITDPEDPVRGDEDAGYGAFASGLSSIAKGRAAHAEGEGCTAEGAQSHAEGNHTTASGKVSHAEGSYTTASGEHSHAEGDHTEAVSIKCHAEGNYAVASGECSHAEGNYTTASGARSHAEGNYTVASGEHSHSEGDHTEASNYAAHSEGARTTASGVGSHVEGIDNKAITRASHAEGLWTKTSNEAEHAQGKYNKSNTGTIHSIGIGTSDSLRKNAVEVMQNGDVYVNGIGGYDGTNPANSKDIATYLPNMVTITYTQLKSLRDNGKLIPGQQYRITDYTCTTKQTNTKSAGHVFDIIVTADSENKLNEEARAIQHEGDTYFTGCDLNAWKLWYCLDNDTTRFAWADNTKGRGVIYRMIDEFGNDCPYDFKNIQFARWELSNPVGYRNDFDYNNWENNWIQESTKFDSLKTGFYGLSSSKEFYYGYNENDDIYEYKVVYTISGSPTYCYTFGKDTDYSINGLNYGNVIKEHKSSNKIRLNNIVFLSRNCYSNSFGDYCYSNSFGDYCYSNSFGNNCYSNSFRGSCNSNSFGNGCSSNTFGEGCFNNSLGNYCDSNGFGYYCSYNSFDNYCCFNGFYDEFSYNSLGNYCYSNGFGDYCYSNSFGNGCYFNSFGNNCENNNFGNYCYSNTLGNDCDNNSFGNYCYNNSFGNNYSNNSFGNSCQYIKFVSDSDDSAFTNYYMNNHFGDGCEFILFKASETASPNNQVQNYNLSQGLKGTPSKNLTINGVRNRSFETKVAKNSAGTLKIYCEADLIL